MLCLLAAHSGFGARSIDTAFNDYVATHLTSRHMNFVHCFYGVGVVLSPLILSLVMYCEQKWRTGYFIVFNIQSLTDNVLSIRGSKVKNSEEDVRDWVKELGYSK